MRYPALEILQENGSRISEFLYKGHSIYQGKPELSGLPATYVEKEEEADTLELYLEDQYPVRKLLYIIQSLRMFRQLHVVRRLRRREIRKLFWTGQ